VRSILNNYQLKIGDTSYVSDVARDVVISSSFGGNTIGKGQQVPKGSRIDLILGDGLGRQK
jgi:hypothetical protein